MASDAWLARNDIWDGVDGADVVPTDDHEVIEAGLVVRAIGYRGAQVDGTPYDGARGVVRNDGGRVCDEDGRHLPGEYAVGWIKRGPSGIIGTNKKDAYDTAARIIEDRAAGVLASPSVPDRVDLVSFYRTHAPQAVTSPDWQVIDVHEVSSGMPLGRPRVKLVTLDELLSCANAVGP